MGYYKDGHMFGEFIEYHADHSVKRRRYIP